MEITLENLISVYSKSCCQDKFKFLIMATHGRLAAESQAAYIVPQAEVNLDNIVPSNDSTKTKGNKRLIFIVVIAVVIIIIVAIIASVVEFEERDENDMDTGNYWWDWSGSGGESLEIDLVGHVNYVCGSRYDCQRVPGVTEIGSCFENLNDTNCAYLCGTQPWDEYDVFQAYWLPNLKQCYCYTYSQNWDIRHGAYKWDHYCFNTTDVVEKYTIDRIIAWIQEGRPYYIDLKMGHNLIGVTRKIDCDEYDYFVKNVNSPHSNIEKFDEWIKRGLSEHASIATFNKFTLELMSINAPLWLIKLSNMAIKDEIRHSKIAFDIANIYKNNSHYHDNYCFIPNVFPSHIINIDTDLNKIAMDTIIGGCFGETISALTIIDNQYNNNNNNNIDKYIYKIAEDEIRHAALAWTTIKWIINNNDNNYDSNIDIIKSKQWWQQIQIIMTKNIKNENEEIIYKHIIPSIVDKLWFDIGYKQFYEMVIDLLQSQLHEAKDSNHECSLL